ncbi:CvpA family protein [bacterium]|nr:CvpA family protein [bacterium]
MRVNPIDLLVVVYLGYGAWRGRARGLPRELPRLLSDLLVAVTGCGIFRWSERFANAISLKAGLASGLTGFIGVIIAAFLLWRLFRTRLREWVARRWPDPDLQRRAGLVAGLLRATVFSALIVVVVSYLPLGPLRVAATEGSLYGRTILRLARPVEALVNGQPKPPAQP